ncbi:MAG: hypothetical protein IT258_03985 [Saprospiraceae bacterium]|nr:hypothetical protein [Saprospiraceae bacterium]
MNQLLARPRHDGPLPRVDTPARRLPRHDVGDQIQLPIGWQQTAEHPIGGTNYFTTFNLSYRIGLTYDMGRVKLMGDFVGLHPHTEVNDAKGEKVKLVQGNFLSVGIGVALVRKWRGYGV